MVITNDQRFFQKVYANMTFGSLHAVDKAYDERDNEERQKMVKKLTEFKREFHDQIKQQLNFIKTDKIEEIKQKANEDKAVNESGKKKVNILA